MKGLIIDEPWISLILRGEKTWEMRKTACHQRGLIALIRKGSGQVVGAAHVVDSLAPIQTPEDYAAAEPFHRIPAVRQQQAYQDGWHIPWVMADAHSLLRPVAYDHPSGAVIWVNLDTEVAERIKAQLTCTPGSEHAATALMMHTTRITDDVPEARLKVCALGSTLKAKPGTTVQVRLTGGNIRSKHIYLGHVLDFFPSDAIGGTNRSETAPHTIRVTFRPGSTIDADIASDKKILRTRGPVREFFEQSRAKEGDLVQIERTGSHSFTFSLHTHS